MRYKVAPPACPLAELTDARRAVGLVPDDEADCCLAIQRAIDTPDRETARSYLVFLQALGLVAESERGYYRTRDSIEKAAIAAAFRSRVFLVNELLESLLDSSLTARAAFDATRPSIPRWERERHTEWESVWRDRVQQLLQWATIFDIVRAVDDHYELVQ